MKTLFAVLLCIGFVAPAAFAATITYGGCPAGYSCDDDPFGTPVPDAVTAHTVYAKRVISRSSADTLGLPTDFAAIAGYFAHVRTDVQGPQRECVTWFDGKNVDQRGTNVFGRRHGPFPSDEDEARRVDPAAQDHSFDRDVRSCMPRLAAAERTTYAGFAVAVEQGDCAPHLGRDFRFRGQLDFVDPNDIYHEVQEYDYVCGGPDLPGRYQVGGAAGDLLWQAERGPHAWMADAVKDLFPYTWTDPHNREGCDLHATPANNTDPANGSLGHFDLGHKCNGSLQELFTERLWITRVHAPVWDPTIQDHYNFALQVDTCSGVNIYEWRGKEAMGEPAPNGTTTYPVGTGGTHDRWYARLRSTEGVAGALDTMQETLPLIDHCTDGSSWSFDDTPRGRTVHAGPPADEGETMRGNSYDHNATSTTFGKHRQNCRTAAMAWPENPHRPAPGSTDCYPEDHKLARVDLYVYDLDPTGGLWYANANGLTGPNAYVAGEPSDA